MSFALQSRPGVQANNVMRVAAWGTSSNAPCLSVLLANTRKQNCYSVPSHCTADPHHADNPLNTNTQRHPPTHTHPHIGRHRHRHMHKHTYTRLPLCTTPNHSHALVVLCIKLTSRHWSWLWLLHIQTPLQCHQDVWVVPNVYSTTNSNQKRSICAHVCSALSTEVHTTFGSMGSLGPVISNALAVGALGSMTITWGGQWGGSTRHMGQWAKSGWFICRYMLRMWVQWLRLYWLGRGQSLLHTLQSHIAPSPLWWCSHRPLGNLNKYIVGVSGISTLATYIHIYCALGMYVHTCTTQTHTQICTHARTHSFIHHHTECCGCTYICTQIHTLAHISIPTSLLQKYWISTYFSFIKHSISIHSNVTCHGEQALSNMHCWVSPVHVCMGGGSLMVQLWHVCVCVRMCIPNPSLNRGTPKRKPSDIYRNANRLQFSIYIHTHTHTYLPTYLCSSKGQSRRALQDWLSRLWLCGWRGWDDNTCALVQSAQTSHHSWERQNNIQRAGLRMKLRTLPVLQNT